MQLFYPLGLPSDNIGIHGFHETTKNQSYIPITGCVLSHILSSSQLSSLEKMYYILADSFTYINSSKGRNRSVSLPAASWAERLSCSKSEVFVLQKSLEDKGYFIIYRDTNDKGQNNRNTITTTVPNDVFNYLKYEPDKFNLNSDGDIDDKTIDHSKSNNIDSIDKTFIPTLEGKRQHLAKTKMFIRVPYQFLKELNSNCSISATSKILLLYLFTKMYKYSVSKYDHNSIVISYQELQQELKLHRNSLTKALKALEEADLIKKYQIVIKSDDDCNNRTDKFLWRISLVNASHITNDSTLHEPKGQIGYDEQEEQFDKTPSVINTTNIVINTYDQENNTGVNHALKPFTEKGCTKYDPPCTDSGQLYNKDFIVNKSINKNIDVKSEKKFLGNELCSFPSKSYKNSSFLNDSCKKNELEQKEEWQELRYFCLLSEKDISLLNSRANREFSNNFVNQLLLKLYIKYPEKRFKNRFTFLSYMEKILKNEKHQGPLVNHTSFRFSCNIGTEEKSLLEYEKYLNQIEDLIDTSKEMCVKKKIAGSYSSEVAYKILTEIELKTNHDNSFITVLIPSNLNLSERQIVILSDQLEAVYGINGYHVQEQEEKEMLPQKTTKDDITSDDKFTKNLTLSNTPSAISEEILENTVWHQIRKGLREELGEAIDTVWFSKAVASECTKTNKLTLTMPTRFMAAWVRNNYSHVIRRVAGSVGIDIVEYG